MITVGITGAYANRQGRRGAQQSPVQLQILDAANQVVWGSQLYSGFSSSVNTSGFKGPFHLRFSGTKKTKDVVVEFELKDLRIP